jgi:hypothetical protein
MTYISKALVLSVQTINENAGRLCFHTVATSSTVTATSELVGFPATNMANPATAFGWESSSTADQTITITNSTRSEIDYIGIARHNLAQAGLEVQIRFDGSVVAPYVAITEKQSQLFLFTVAIPETIQIDIRGISNAAKIAVIYCGLSVELERNIYVGHTPINYGRDRSTVQGVSQSGEYLGEVILNETLSTSVSLQNLTPNWYRATLDPFFGRKPRDPCFWAWRPGSYPTEVSYCWVEGNPRPSNQRSNGMMQIDWNFRGIE